MWRLHSRILYLYRFVVTLSISTWAQIFSSWSQTFHDTSSTTCCTVHNSLINNNFCNRVVQNLLFILVSDMSVRTWFLLATTIYYMPNIFFCIFAHRMNLQYCAIAYSILNSDRRRKIFIQVVTTHECTISNKQPSLGVKNPTVLIPASNWKCSNWN